MFLQGVVLSSDRPTDIHSGGRFCEVCKYGGREKHNWLRQTEQQTPLTPGEDRGRAVLSFLHIYYVRFWKISGKNTDN